MAFGKRDVESVFVSSRVRLILLKSFKFVNWWLENISWHLLDNYLFNSWKQVLLLTAEKKTTRNEIWISSSCKKKIQHGYQGPLFHCS